MKKWVQKTAGLILSTFLTLGLGVKAHAVSDEETLPVPSPTEAVEPAAEMPSSESNLTEDESGETNAPDAVAEEDPSVEEDASADDASSGETLFSETALLGEDESEEAAPVGETLLSKTAPLGEDEPAGAAPVEETLLSETAPVGEAEPAEVAPVEGALLSESAPVGEAEPALTVAAEEPKTVEVAVFTLSDTPQRNIAVRSAVSVDSTAAAGPLSVEGSGLPEEGNTISRSMTKSENEGLSAEITIGGKDVSLREGWYYNESTGQIGLVNYDHPEASIVSTGQGGLDIVASGCNRILSIISEGDVHITGTGLLLLDSVSLGENSNFYLHTPLDIYEDGTGSVAVFLKTGEKQYTLVNGGVVGLLDEQYTITDVDLVVPENSTLFLNSGGTVYDKDTREVLFRYTGNQGSALVAEYGVTASPIEEDCSHGIDETYGTLTIGSGASLTVENGGTIRMESTQGIRSWSDIAAPMVAVENGGAIILNGSITGDGRIKLNANSSLSGSGSAEVKSMHVSSPEDLSDCGVKFKSGEIRIYGSGTISKLVLDSSNVFLDFSSNPELTVAIPNLTNFGNSSIINRHKLTLGSITNSGCLTLYSDTEYPSTESVFELNGPVSGGTLHFTGGVFHLMESFALKDEATLSCDHVIVYDHYGSSAAFVAPLMVSPSQVTVPTLSDHPTLSVDCYAVPLVIVKSDYTSSFARGTTIISKETSTVFFTRNENGRFVLNLGDASSYVGGTNLLAELLSGSNDIYSVVIELHDLYSDNTLSFRVDDYDPWCLDLANAPPQYEFENTYLVRITVTKVFPILPSASLTSTSTSFTGTGILGGSGAGSFTGGVGNQLHFGSDTSDQGSDTDPGSPVITPPAADEPESPPAETGDADAVPLRIVVNETGNFYKVASYYGDQEIVEPGQKLTVNMEFKLPAGWNGRDIYAVFRNADGTLTAFKASYSELKRILSFDTDITGTFVLVCFSYDGEPYTEDFYAALEELDIIRILPVCR